jgi:hypothetical protein
MYLIYFSDIASRTVYLKYAVNDAYPVHWGTQEAFESVWFKQKERNG